MLSNVPPKRRLVGILVYILSFLMLGSFIAKNFNIIFYLNKDIVPNFFQVFVANLTSSILLMMSNFLFGLGLFGVTYLSFSLGLQFYSVVLAYGVNNLLSILPILSIHGLFEIAVMIIICNAAISNLAIWKHYLYGDLESLSHSYKVFFKNTFVKSLFWIFIFILIGSLLETSLSTYLFKCL